MEGKSHASHEHYGDVHPQIPHEVRSTVGLQRTASIARFSGNRSAGSLRIKGSQGILPETLALVPDASLPSGLRALLSRLVDTKDMGIMSYLSSGSGSGLRIALAPLPSSRAVRTTKSFMGKPMKSAMKIGAKVNQPLYEPTYRLEPTRPFRMELVTKILHYALEGGLAGSKYTPQFAVDAARILAAYITHAVKTLDFSRYKIGVAVCIQERAYQGTTAVMRALWDGERDGFCQAQYMTPTLAAQAVVFAVYWE